jgi:hypothetical protein
MLRCWAFALLLLPRASDRSSLRRGQSRAIASRKVGRELGYCSRLMPRFGEQPRPRVLFQGFEDDDPEYQAMARLVPTPRVMPERGFDALRIAEWDIVVSKATSIDARANMHGLALGCEHLGLVMVSSNLATQVVWGAQPSEVMEVPDDLPDPIRRLVIGELIRICRRGPPARIR